MTRDSGPPALRRSVRLLRVLLRTAIFAAIWLLMLPSLKTGDLATGAIAVAAASWASLRLRPPEAGALRLGLLPGLALHFIGESVRAGVDVARRALGARVRVRPGFIECPLDFPPGLARNRFASFTSLLPGTVACGDRNGELVYHCLDVAEPVLEQLWAEEKRLALVLVAGRSHG